MTTNKQKRIIKIVAIILSITMILSVVYSIIFIIIGMAREEEQNKRIEDIQQKIMASVATEPSETTEVQNDSDFEVVAVE